MLPRTNFWALNQFGLSLVILKSIRKCTDWVVFPFGAASSIGFDSEQMEWTKGDERERGKEN